MRVFGVVAAVAMVVATPAAAKPQASFFVRDRTGAIVSVSGFGTAPAAPTTIPYTSTGTLSRVVTESDDATPTSFALKLASRTEVQNLDLAAAGMTAADQKRFGRWLLANGGRRMTVSGYRIGNGQIAVPDRIARAH